MVSLVRYRRAGIVMCPPVENCSEDQFTVFGNGIVDDSTVDKTHVNTSTYVPKDAGYRPLRFT